MGLEELSWGQCIFHSMTWMVWALGCGLNTDCSGFQISTSLLQATGSIALATWMKDDDTGPGLLPVTAEWCFPQASWSKKTLQSSGIDGAVCS